VRNIPDVIGYNRYSYVGNNPMNRTDPSGYFSLKDLFMVSHYSNPAYWISPNLYRRIEPAIRGIVLTAILTYASWGTGATWAAAAGGAVSGFESSLLNGGSVGDAFKSGVIGGATGYVTGYLTAGIGDYYGHSVGSWDVELERALTHGAVGGAISEIEGGSFSSGFYGSVVGSLAGSFSMAKFGRVPGWTGVGERTAIAAVAGGTAAQLGGVVMRKAAKKGRPQKRVRPCVVRPQKRVRPCVVGLTGSKGEPELGRWRAS
jgi:hypothetical protein